MKKHYLLLLLLMLPMFSMVAQEAKFKAVFTLNFIRYIGWPESSLQGDFVIGVVRDREIADWIRSQSEGKKFGFQDVVVREYRSIDEVEGCQVIYVSSSINLRSNSEALINKARQKNSLIITDSEGATNHGSAINFVVRDGTLRFELHKANAARMGLQFSSRLEGMAAAINL
ncbi:YfiR family protein [Alkaliflexus imshenetskii]|uniref:YfiR family protein n=1 Tax=Alkaliflexus imshenetskii TaxID=286730 RepID=UPI00047ECF37|nr:YfiR family protein [Alkaliflexus imshenetskii]